MDKSSKQLLSADKELVTSEAKAEFLFGGQISESSQSNVSRTLDTPQLKDSKLFMQASHSYNLFSKPKEDKQTSNIFGQREERISIGNPFIVNNIGKGELKQNNNDQSCQEEQLKGTAVSLFGGNVTSKGPSFGKSLFGSQPQSSKNSADIEPENAEASMFKPKLIQSDIFGGKVTPVFGQIISTTESSESNKMLSDSNIANVKSHRIASNLFGGPPSNKTFNQQRFGAPKNETLHVNNTDSLISKPEKPILNPNASVFQSSALFENKTFTSPHFKSVIPTSLQTILESPLDLRSPLTQGQKEFVISDRELFGLDPVKDQLTVPEKKQQPTALVAIGIPDKQLNRSVLETHFRKFGDVNKIVINKKTNQASIYFTNHESAAAAKNKGKILHPNFPELKLFFSSTTSTGRRKSRESTAIYKSNERPIINYGDVNEFPFSMPIPKQAARFSLKSMIEPKASHRSGLLEVKPAERTPKLTKRVVVPKLFGSTTEIIAKPSVKKVSKVMNETKKSENLSSRTKAPSGNLTTIKEYSVLALSQAHNNYDKYLILDARDKNIRSKQEKVLDVTKAKYLLATCPDMCPEKERYSRDIQYDVSSYEMIKGELTHNLAVKKFSRSSADKDEPLPHELRPGPVLKMTMDFLTTNIINKEGKVTQLDVWYNYLCNRTRALRNDIMTQHLVDENAVYVLEKITRFHIHCSHNLCEEPSDLFDSKMNIEHLTKSLQSLKESYHDMAEKGVFFETEAEFRGYEMLLNVYDGNIILRYLKFRDPVRNSYPVQFAMRVLHAIQSNNYVKFFKILKEATYLQACIMHRHFLSMRLRVLSVIMKAYTLPKEVQVLPSTKIMSLLCFGNEDKFKTFIEPFGLQVTENKYNRNLAEEQVIIINPASFNLKPDSIPSTQKSFEFVESKREESVGSVIQGGPLPHNPLATYSTHNSFNDRGYLTKSAFDASDQQKIEQHSNPNIENQLSVYKDSESKQQKEERMLLAKIDELHRFNVMRNVFRTWIHFTKNQINQRLLEAEQMKIMKHAVDHWRSFASKSVELKERADKFIMSKYFARLKKYTCASREMKLLKAQVKLVFKRILAKKYLHIWKKSTEESKRQKKIQVLRKQIITRKYLIQWRLKAILSSFEKEVDIFYKIKLLKSTFVKWKNYLDRKKNKRKRDSVNFPAICSQLSLDDQNKALDWGYDREQSVNLSIESFYVINDRISESSKKHKCIEDIRGHIAWRPLPFMTKFKDDVSQMDIKRSTCYRRPFKIVLLIDPTIDPYLKEWIEKKFDCEGQLQLKKNCLLSSRTIGVKIPVIIEKQSLNSNMNLNSASFAVIVSDKNQQKQLLQTLSSTLDSFLLLSKSSDVGSFNECCWSLTKEDMDCPKASKKLFDLLNKRWNEYLADDTLTFTALQNLVQSFISKNVLGPLFHTAGKVLGRNKPFLAPSTYISFYNDALTYLIKVLQSIKRIPDKSRIISSVKKAFLPQLKTPNLPLCTYVDALLTDYLKSVADDSDWSGNLYSEIRRITKCSAAADVNKETTLLIDFDDAAKVPWLDIITSCVFYKMSYLPMNQILYDQQTINNYDNSHWLSEISKTELRNVVKAELQINQETPKKRKLPPSSPSSDEKRYKKSLLDYKCNKKSPASSKFLMDLAKEKQKCQQFEQKMHDISDIDDELKELALIYSCL